MPVTAWSGHYIGEGQARGGLVTGRVVTIRGRLGRHNSGDSSGLGGGGACRVKRFGLRARRDAAAYIDIASVARPSLIVRTPRREHEGECGQHIMCAFCSVRT